MGELHRVYEGPFCMLCHVEETATGDAREDATLKTARAAREAGTVRNIMGILRHSEGVQLSRWDSIEVKEWVGQGGGCVVGGERVAVGVVSCKLSIHLC